MQWQVGSGDASAGETSGVEVLRNGWVHMGSLAQTVPVPVPVPVSVSVSLYAKRPPRRSLESGSRKSHDGIVSCSQALFLASSWPGLP